MQPRPAELLAAAMASAALAVVYWFPALRRPDSTGFGDWQMVHHNWEAAYTSLARFGEWPLWDPFHCGGVTILGNPESQLYAPWFWLSFMFGTVIAVKFMLLAHGVIALTGMYWLARCRYQLQAPSAALAAIGWAFCGCFTWDGAGGHATFLPFAFAPWLSYFVHRGRDLRREIAAVAALLLLTLYSGGTYPLPYFALWLLAELSLRAYARRALRETALFALGCAGILALAGAIRFVPIYLTLSRHPRTVPNDDALALAEVWEMLTARTHGWRVPGHPFVWPEYGSYLGYPLTILGLLGCMIALRKPGLRHLTVWLALYTCLMLGNLGAFAPFTLLHHLPVYDSLRVPSRFAIFVTFFLSLLAGLMVDWVLLRLKQRLQQPIGSVLALGAFIDLATAAYPIAEMWREPPLDRSAPAEALYLVKRNYYRFYASYPGLNLGTPICYVGGIDWKVSPALWMGREPQLKLAGDTGSIEELRQTPNAYRARLRLRADSHLIFNQNFAPGYVSNHGQPIADRGRLALDLPAGTYQLELRYRPPEFLPSAAVSGMGLMLLCALASLPTRRTTRTAASPSQTPPASPPDPPAPPTTPRTASSPTLPS